MAGQWWYTNMKRGNRFRVSRQICSQCGNEFINRHPQKRCSRACTGISQRKHISPSDRSRAYRLRNSELVQEAQRAYRAKNREILNERRRLYVAKNTDKINAYSNRQDVRERRMAGWRRRQYGVSDEKFELMIQMQDGLCAICKQRMVPPHVDHDHITGRVRGLLCGKCNKALGLLGDDVQMLQASINYLAASASGVFTLA